MTARGRFVVFEGGEGCGKSTQVARLASRLGALATRQPGGTEVGARLRELLLDPATGALSARAELLLMAADRAQHVDEVIEPTLAAGRDVVCDRYSGSSIAYQGYGRGLDVTRIAELSAFAADGLEPDLVILLVVPEAVAVARLGAERDRFEAEDAAFHQRIAEGFLSLAGAEPARWAVVDGDGTVDDVAAAVAAVVDQRLGLRT